MSIICSVGVGHKTSCKSKESSKAVGENSTEKGFVGGAAGLVRTHYTEKVQRKENVLDIGGAGS